MLIDTHCHLTDERFLDIRAELDKAKRAGISTVVMLSTSLGDARKAIKIAEEYGLYCLVGIHPEETGSLKETMDKVTREMEELIKSSKRVVGIGEIGMDFYYDTERKTEEKQRELFRVQMEMALRNKLPVAIHMRGAEEEMKAELKLFIEKYSEGEKKFKFNGQFHCFDGSESFLQWILDLGFYVSFAGNITYKSAGRLRELIRKVPLDRLLLETDSPYLPPEPLRGTVNTPANVKITAEFVAQQLKVDPNELAEITSQNAKCLYSLDT